jgi:cytochrome c oxidase subunit 2
MKGELAGSLPITASELAGSWDTLYISLVALLTFFFLIVFVSMILFAIKYRARPGHQAEHITHHDKLEFIWTAVPTVLVVGIFIWGWIVYREMYMKIPADAMEVKVVAQQWQWTFQYEDGRTLTNQLVVPKNKPIKLLMTAKINDVIHSFYVPNLRIKRDAVPGMYTTVWFRANVVGQHQIFCAEYCGADHSNMLAKLVVLEEDQWNLWKWGGKVDFPPPVGLGEMVAGLSSSSGEDMKPVLPLAVQGKKLTESKGCVACHTDDGSRRIGPSYKGLFMSEVELSTGEKVTADENYIRESIMKPQAKLVKGFEAVLMPPYLGQLDENEMNAVIAYIKSLK